MYFAPMKNIEENLKEDVLEDAILEEAGIKRQKTTFKDVLFFILRIVIAAGIIYWLIHGNFTKFRKALDNFNYIWLLPAVALYSVHLLAGVWRWHLLLKIQKVKITFYETLSLAMQGIFFSLVIPGAFGGDFIKGAYLVKHAPKGNKLSATFTILIDRILGMIALFTLASIAGAFCYSFIIHMAGYMELIAYALLFGTLSGVCSVVFLFFHRYLEKVKLIKKLLDFIDRLTHGAVSHLTEAMDLFRTAWKTLFSTLMISIFMIHGMLAFVVFFIGKGLGINLAFKIYVLATSLANAVGTIPMAPSGIGARDALLKNIVEAAGVSEGQSLALAFLFTGFILLFNLSGGIFFILSKKFKMSQTHEEE